MRCSEHPFLCPSQAGKHCRELIKALSEGAQHKQERRALTGIVVEAQHEVGDEGEQERLHQVVGHLDQALRGRKGQLTVHSSCAFPVHHLQMDMHSMSAHLALHACWQHVM